MNAAPLAPATAARVQAVGHVLGWAPYSQHVPPGSVMADELDRLPAALRALADELEARP